MGMNVSINSGGCSFAPTTYSAHTAVAGGVSIELQPSTSYVYVDNIESAVDMYFTFGASAAEAITNLDINAGDTARGGIFLTGATNTGTSILASVPNGATHLAAGRATAGDVQFLLTEGF